MLRGIKQYKVEIILLAMLTVALAGYVWMQEDEAGAETAALQSEQVLAARKRMLEEADIDEQPGTPGLQEQMYCGISLISRELFQAYQMKTIGESVTIYEGAPAPQGKGAAGKRSVTVQKVERLSKEQEVRSIDGYANVAVTAEINNEGGAGYLYFLSSWTCQVVDENGKQREEYDYYPYVPHVEPADGKALQFYSAVKGTDGKVIHIPTESVSVLPSVFIEADSRRTLRIVYYVPEELIDRDDFALISGIPEEGYYLNSNFVIYLNRRKEEQHEDDFVYRASESVSQ